MKTTQEFIEENHSNLFIDLAATKILMAEYAKEAIKADREELSKLVNKRLENEYEIRAFLIDGSSIINAPFLDLK